MSSYTKLARSGFALGAVAGSLLLANSVQAANENVSASISLDYNSHFMSYGKNTWGADQIGNEFLFEPSASLEFKLSETSAIYTGLWWDINSQANTGGGGVGKYVQETDFWIGYYFSVDKFTFDFTWQQWYYTGDTEGIIDVKVSYDTMFSPYIKAHTRYESSGVQQKGTIYEVGATAYSTEVGTFSLSVPVAVGFSFDDFHTPGEEGYAYSMVGLGFSTPIGIPDSYGSWNFHGQLSYYNTSESYTGNEHSHYLTLNLGVGIGF